MSYSERELTIFYDGQCPLCNREMQHLRKLDISESIELFDISNPELSERLQTEFANIDPVQANRILHGVTANGELLLGLDVTHKAWSLVGKGHWIAPLRWKLIAPISDRIYLLFAKHRQTISALASGRWPSQSCKSCSVD
ncbi:MAG: thiol-disulfide oxidoreductase DCC family protein [Oceanobacter sp.]